MTIISHLYAFVVGVDTHAKNHVYSVLTNTGEHVDTAAFPTTKAGLKRALTWAGRRTGGDLDTLWVIEGIGTYGAILADHVAETGTQSPRPPAWMLVTGMPRARMTGSMPDGSLARSCRWMSRGCGFPGRLMGRVRDCGSWSRRGSP